MWAEKKDKSMVIEDCKKLSNILIDDNFITTN